MGKGEITRNTLIFTASTMASRILGFIRDMLIAGYFGAGSISDAFFVAFRIPNLFRRLLGEGALSSAFIPVFAHEEERGKNIAEIINSAFWSLLIVLILILAIGELFTPQLVSVIAPGFFRDRGLFDLTVRLTKITFPYIFFMGNAILIGAALNYRRDFLYTSLAPCLLNISFIFFILVLYGRFKEPVFCLAWAVFAGGLLQLLFHVYGAYRVKVLPSGWERPFTEPVIRAIKLMGPATVGLAIHQINTLVDTVIASLLPAGSISYLYYANRLFQLPLALFGTATGYVLLPYASSYVAKGRREELLENARYGVGFVLFVTLPAASGLVVFSLPIVDLLFRRGSFGIDSSSATAYALAMYALGLPVISITKVVVSLFHAHMDMKTPVKAAAIALVANILLNLILMHPLKHAGLALATSLASVVQIAFLVSKLRRHSIKLGDLIPPQTKRVFAANAALVAAMLLMAHLLPYNTGWKLPKRISAVATYIAASVALYLTMAWRLRIEVLKEIARIIRRR